MINEVTKGSLFPVEEGAELYNFKFNKGTEYVQAYVLNANSFLDNTTVPYRLNSACITSELFGDLRCDCKWQLDEAIKLVKKQGFGIITYHANHEGKGHGLSAKLSTFKSNGEVNAKYKNVGKNEEDVRDFSTAVEILKYFGVTNVELIGNNYSKKNYLTAHGIIIKHQTPLIYNLES
ncbi:hypothetical protein AB3K25_00555 [Leuconostoc sp. MS02]|uniref:GTP cyclohydrolase II domain-containing protein n=1 Tax=Leuconostoc aquikimchii TaxID=3236804 RepID=A0ABV3S883_9LACO